MNSKMFLIIGGLILVASLYIFATTLTPIEAKTIFEYQLKCHEIKSGQTILEQIGKGAMNCESWPADQLRKDIAAEEDRKLFNGISLGGAGIGSLMFIYGLSLQRKEQG